MYFATQWITIMIDLENFLHPSYMDFIVTGVSLTEPLNVQYMTTLLKYVPGNTFSKYKNWKY